MSDPLQARISSPAKKTRWFAIGAIAIAGTAIAVIASGSVGKNLVYYWGPTQLREAGNRAVGATIRLGGQVAPGSIHFDPGSSSLDFIVRDSKAEVQVHSVGVPPQMFRENVGVVVEGTITETGKFESNRLMVSHDNQYRPPKAGEEVKTADLMKTTTGMDKPERPQ